MKENILFIVHRIPYPPNKGDKIRAFHIFRHLARSYSIHLAAFIDDPCDYQYKEKMEEMCESTCILPLHPVKARLRSLTGLLNHSALSVPYFYDHKMQEWIDSLLQKEEIQAVFVYSSQMAKYVLNIRRRGLKRIADFVDIDSDKWRQYALHKHWPASWLYRREADCLLKFEREVAAQFDTTIFVSSGELALFKQLAPEVSERVMYMDNGVDADYFSPERSYENPYADDTRVLVFTGAMDYWANIDAVRWFALHVFPDIHKLVPSARFAIVGTRPAREVQQLATLPGVDVTGAVPDTRPYLAHAHAVVAPLRIARGVQNKVLEAMAMAKVVLATSPAVEGIDINDREVLQVADTGDRFVDLAIQLLNQKKLTAAPVSRQWVCQRYDWKTNLSQINEIFTQSHSHHVGVSLLGHDKLSENPA